VLRAAMQTLNPQLQLRKIILASSPGVLRAAMQSSEANSLSPFPAFPMWFSDGT
jgi:hypothetical protein